MKLISNCCNKGQAPESVDLHLSKALFSQDPDNLQLHCLFRVGDIVLLFVLFVLSTNHEHV